MGTTAHFHERHGNNTTKDDCDTASASPGLAQQHPPSSSRPQSPRTLSMPDLTPCNSPGLCRRRSLCWQIIDNVAGFDGAIANALILHSNVLEPYPGAIPRRTRRISEDRGGVGVHSGEETGGGSIHRASNAHATLPKVGHDDGTQVLHLPSSNIPMLTGN